MNVIRHRRAHLLGAAALAIGLPATSMAQSILDEITVTAQRRTENMQDVPISVTPLSGERLTSMFESGEDIRALATRVPSLYAESSNGRVAPRFYIRGLGNTDFDLAASQPVSIIFDEVVQENVILKSFPIFDVQQVEVLRGPQGTLFGRNTPAGIVKFESVKPSQESSGYLSFSAASLDTVIAEGAMGGALISDVLSGRIAFLHQNRGDWIDNGFTGENDALGGFTDTALRLQLLYTPTDQLSMLLNIHDRTLDGTSSIFRANVIGPGNNDLNSNFDRDTVFYDEGDNNPQEYDSTGASLKIDYDFSDSLTLTSITAHETTGGRSLGDIDGGFGAVFLPEMGPGFIPFPAVTQDAIDNLDQFTQEFRLASQGGSAFNWQAGFFYFKSEFAITTSPFFVPPSTVVHDNDAWAVFGQASYALNDQITITGGLRYTDDEKEVQTFNEPVPSGTTSVSGDELSWDLSVLYAANDDLNFYARAASGFRAPSIQGRDVAFFGVPSVAQSETIFSIEAGFKSELMSDRLRLNGSVFHYTVDDQQLTAIGGVGNTVQLVNANEGTGTGFDIDGQFVVNDNLVLTAGFSFNDTEINDSALAVAPCGSGACTVLDPLDGNGNALVDGNPFPNAPETTFNFTAEFTRDAGQNGEIFAFLDYARQGETNFLIYDAVEFSSDGNSETGIRLGYRHNDGQYEVALFGRNITDEENLKGTIDFNNLTGFVNEPQIFGITLKANF